LVFTPTIRLLRVPSDQCTFEYMYNYAISKNYVHGLMLFRQEKRDEKV